MTISYPLTPPTSPKPSSVRWTEINIIGNAVSQYTLQRQVYDWGGCAWQIDVEFDPLTRAEAQPWIAFLSALRGTLGSFYFGDTLMNAPLGSGSATPRVNGAGQTGFTLNTENWFSWTNNVLKAGDMFSIDNHLYRNLTDANTTENGEVTLNIFPRARNHADHASIVTASPVGIFRLIDNSIVTQYAGRNSLWDISFSAIEVV